MSKFQVLCSCLRCKRVTTTGQLTRNHSGDYCPGMKPESEIIQKTVWNKGLTKETDERVLRNSIGVSKGMKKCILEGRHHGVFSSEFWTEEERIKKSEEKKEYFRKHPEKHPNRLLANNRNKMTYPERVAFDWLERNLIEFSHQVKIDKYHVDFLIGMKIIEIDGEQWHPIGNESDLIRDRYLISIGYEVFRIRSKERIEERLKEIISAWVIG